jgi:hypothetical protein
VRVCARAPCYNGFVPACRVDAYEEGEKVLFRHTDYTDRGYWVDGGRGAQAAMWEASLQLPQARQLITRAGAVKTKA